jgi:predicted phage tail protein
MQVDEFAMLAADTPLTERQAEAFWHRHVAGHGRDESAEAMDTSASNVDNLERAARGKIIQAHNLTVLASAVDAEPGDWGAAIGTCARCDDPADTLTLHPDDAAAEVAMEDARQVCPDCEAALTAE